MNNEDEIIDYIFYQLSQSETIEETLSKSFKECGINSIEDLVGIQLITPPTGEIFKLFPKNSAF